MRLVIGSKNLSSWSLRAWMVLCEGGIPFEEIVIPLARPDTREQLTRWSPTGRVPVLQDGETLVWDSLAIAEYVAEIAPHLWPADRAARAMARSVSAEMHSGFADLRNFLPMDASARFSPPGKLLRGVAADLGRIQTLWRTARDRYGHDGPYLFGRFSIADAMFAPVVSRLVTYAVPVEGPAQAYVDTMLRNPWMHTWLNDAAAEVSNQLMGTPMPNRPATGRPASPQRGAPQGGPMAAQDIPVEIPARATTIIPPGQPPQPGQPPRSSAARDRARADSGSRQHAYEEPSASDGGAGQTDPRQREQRSWEQAQPAQEPRPATQSRPTPSPRPGSETRPFSTEPPRAVPPLPTSVAPGREPPAAVPPRPAPPAAATYLDEEPEPPARAGRGRSWWRSAPEPAASSPSVENERAESRRSDLRAEVAPTASSGVGAARTPVPPLPTALQEPEPASFTLDPSTPPLAASEESAGAWIQSASQASLDHTDAMSPPAGYHETAQPTAVEEPLSFNRHPRSDRAQETARASTPEQRPGLSPADPADGAPQPRPVNRFAAALSAGRLAWEKRQEELNAGLDSGDAIARPPVRPGGIKPIGSGLNRRR